MLEVDTPMDLKAHSHADLGTTDWVEISQEMITQFADLTGDDHWIHVDVERAKTDQPDGKTIAHGLFLLALTPLLQRQLFRIRHRGTGLNYGYDKIRFTAPVPVGSRVRLKQGLGNVTPKGNGALIELTSTIEIEHSPKPALVAQGLLMIANPPAGD